MRGIGERLDPVPRIPPFWIVLVNPGVEVPTGPVFRALERVGNTGLPDPDWTGLDGLVRWLARTRNDLEPAARGLVPEVDEALGALSATQGCRIARMSGSGGTCFGIYADEAAARGAAAHLEARRDWWVKAAPVLTGAPPLS
jgi:4-diphosphocytidyl-2-C-methyl-D-erythritol kinase